MKDLYGFLGVDDTFVQDLSEWHNVSDSPRSGRLDAFLKGSSTAKALIKRLTSDRLRRRVTRSAGFQRATRDKPRIDPSAAAWLATTYRQDILRLQELLGRDLTHWLESIET